MLSTSSPSSYHTAASSQVSDASKDEKPLYRDAKQLPYELRHHCLIYLEEGLYTNALTLLNNLLISGTADPRASPSAFIPPPSHIALASTLLVHPTLTTRATSNERLQVSSHALVYLRNLLAIVGPSKAGLSEAFNFSQNRGQRRNKRRSKSRAGSVDSSNESGDEPIGSPLAHEGALWNRAQDFWHIVGWAFNCSVVHRNRWPYWKVWVEYMLDVIEADWAERSDLSNDQSSSNLALEDSLLIKYLSDGGGRASVIKRAVKSIFAEGTTESIRAFGEIFSNETKEKKSAQAGTKRKPESQIDIEQDRYGDYIDDDDYDMEDETQNSRRSARVVDHGEEIEASDSQPAEIDADPMGGPEAVILRLRLISLLSRACDSFPTTVVSLPILYDMFYENIRPLPLQTFSLIISPSAQPHIPSIALSSLCQLHLRRLLQTSAPAPRTENDELNQETLEDCFLPFSANTSSVEDNAKVSLLIETLFRLFSLSCDVEPSPTLTAAVEQGIAARQAKTKRDRRKKFGGLKDREDDRNRVWLNMSAKRIRFLLKALEMKALRQK